MKLRTFLLVAQLLRSRAGMHRPRWRVRRLRVELEDLVEDRGPLPARLLH